MALALDYAVTICDPRDEYADGWMVPGTQLVRTMPDDTVIEFSPDKHTAIVALTHDPKLDDLALMEALKSDAFYVGAIGSQKNQAKRKERLLEFGVSGEQLERLHGPVGLKNGARTPPEIAVSILAEMTATKYGYRMPHADCDRHARQPRRPDASPDGRRSRAPQPRGRSPGGAGRSPTSRSHSHQASAPTPPFSTLSADINRSAAAIRIGGHHGHRVVPVRARGPGPCTRRRIERRPDGPLTST